MYRCVYKLINQLLYFFPKSKVNVREVAIVNEFVSYCFILNVASSCGTQGKVILLCDVSESGKTSHCTCNTGCSAPTLTQFPQVNNPVVLDPRFVSNN